MEFYEKNGHPKGFNFPFWTDHKSFPVIYNPNNTDTDIVFLGNMNDQVRRKHYLEVTNLPFSKRVYGLLDSDPLGIHGGFIKEAYIHTPGVTEVLSKAKLGLSFPQFFTEYNGLHYDFPKLASLGYFQFPSRAIQYAASGLPIAAVGDERITEVYPEIFLAESVEGLKVFIERVVSDREFALSTSNKILDTFRQSYSALSRAYMLIELMSSFHKYSVMSVAQRSVLFTKFPVEYNESTY